MTEAGSFSPNPVPALPAIEAHGIVKTFGRGAKAVHALRGVSFTIPQGVVYSILGPNGAGKTTLMRILTTLSRPHAGSAKILGHDVVKDPLPVRNEIGVVFQDNHFNKYLTLWQNVALHAQMHGMPKKVYEAEMERLFNTVGLYERRHSLPDQLSGGMKRRLSLIRALLHKPKLLFLDEPTTGLDPQVRREIWDEIAAIRNSGTVILTTHYMEEADSLSDHILMLHHGQVMMTGTPRELKRAMGPKNQYEIVFHTPMAESYQQKLKAAGYPETKILTSHSLQITLTDAQTFRQVLDLIEWGDIQQAGELQVDLESVFLSMASSKEPSPVATPGGAR